MTDLLAKYESQAVILGETRDLPLSIRENLARAGLARFLGLPQPENFDAHKNFSYSTVATAPSPASSGTSLVVAASDGALFPTPPFNATVWPAGLQPLASNAEIVRVTGISTDTLTITRAQESSSARSIIVGDQIAATITKKTITDLEVVPPGFEIGYDQATTNITISATSSGSPTTIVQGSAYTFDGAPVLVEFFCGSLQLGANDLCIISLYEGSTELCRFLDIRSGGGTTGINPAIPVYGSMRFTPTAGSHTYKAAGFRSANNANTNAGSGSGGAGTYPPTFLRFTKV